jgi:phage terminase large subunit GpA-like protein
VKRQTPDRWAAVNRIYGSETGVPGARDPGLTPYVIPFVCAFSDPRYRRVVLCCGAQLGKSDALLDVIGERLDNRPAPIIYVGPSKEFLIDQFEPRLVELFRQSTSLAGKVLGGLDRKRQKKTLKRIAGGRIRLAHAGSSTALKSDPAALALVDEYDELLKDVKHQGDPLGLIEARGATYADFVTGITSTPSVGNVDVQRDERSGLEFWRPAPPEDLESPIWKVWQEGTMAHWCWPCLQCEQYFVPRFSCLKWETRADGAKATPSEAARSAYLECPHCGGILVEDNKRDMNARGRYVAPGQTIDADGTVTGDPPDTSTISFWVSGLASPFVSFGERAESYLKAVRLADPARIRTAINASFGELYAGGGGEAPDWAAVAAHKSAYAKGELPTGVRLLVCTVDVQKNRLVYVIRGWGARATSWLIDFGSLHGETIESAVWNDLADLIAAPIGNMQIKLTLIDSGYRPGKLFEFPSNRVYDFARRFPRHVRVAKGSSTPLRVPLITNRIEVTMKGTAAKTGLAQLRLDTDFFKSWVHERIRWPNDAPGAWYLPHDTSDDYCAQLVSEARERLSSGRVRWVRRDRTNHFLDCESMQAAAAHLLNVVRISEARPEPRAQQPMPASPDPAESEPAEAPQPAPEQPKGSGWTSGTLHSEIARQREQTWIGGRTDGWWNR